MKQCSKIIYRQVTEELFDRPPIVRRAHEREMTFKTVIRRMNGVGLNHGILRWTPSHLPNEHYSLFISSREVAIIA